LLVNQSFAPTSVRDVEFVITRPSGKTSEYRFLVNAHLPQARDFRILAAGDTVEVQLCLTDKYLLNETGEYTVQAIYQNQSDPGDGRTAWKGELKSNEVKFTIEP
jgi:hypothetical protein